MSPSLSQELKRTAEQAPTADQLPDAGELWSQARRANRRSALVTAVVVVAAVLLGGVVVRAAVQPDAVPPADQPEQVGFPGDIYDIPSRTSTTEEAGLLGPLAYVRLGEHQGFWPWSDTATEVYGVSAVTGEYRFLSLPELNPTLDVMMGTNPLSPDGNLMVYPYGVREKNGASGVAVYDSSTGEATRYPIDFERGALVTWVAWSPDGAHAAIGLAECMNKEVAPDCSGYSFRAPVMFDVESDGFRVLAGVPGDLGLTQQPAWKPAGENSPEGLAAYNGRRIVIRDPQTGAVVGRFEVPRQNQFQGVPIWNRSGDAFVVSDNMCGNVCQPEDTRTVKGTLLGDGTVRIRAIAEPDVLSVPIGWTGPDADAGVMGIGLADGGATQELQILDSSGMTHRPLSATYVAGVLAAADVVETGELSDATAPRWPWGWDMALVLLVGLLYVGRFARGVQAQYGVRPPSAGIAHAVRMTWRHDGVAALSLVPALSVAAALVVRQVGWFDPISIGLTMALTWWAVGRSWAGYNLLAVVLIGYTLVTAIWRVDGWLDITMVCLIGLAQLACLGAKGTFEYMRFGSGQGPTPGFGAGFNSASAAGLWSQASGGVPVSGND